MSCSNCEPELINCRVIGTLLLRRRCLLTVDPGRPSRGHPCNACVAPFCAGVACSPSIRGGPRGPPVQRMRCTLLRSGATLAGGPSISQGLLAGSRCATSVDTTTHVLVDA